ncbi:hypothetical protein RchiOBHm_Chr7g0226831 [Rosa chinensis]|uniref:Uncharacterized protein n=1 Tax=Rosa chinensis TaxID=74649 RepID=A0A2P6PEH6_ROSCH|nr:hypothetical protein RchiOBHm_Chr7g0226831 [Rosa chinensis]
MTISAILLPVELCVWNTLARFWFLNRTNSSCTQKMIQKSSFPVLTVLELSRSRSL